MYLCRVQIQRTILETNGIKKSKAAAKAIEAGEVLGAAKLTVDGMLSEGIFVGAGEVAPRAGGGEDADGAIDGAGVALIMADGAGVAEVGTSSMTATKSKSSTALVSPHDPSVLPARITLPSDPARVTQVSEPVVPSCRVLNRDDREQRFVQMMAVVRLGRVVPEDDPKGPDARHAFHKRTHPAQQPNSNIICKDGNDFNSPANARALRRPRTRLP